MADEFSRGIDQLQRRLSHLDENDQKKVMGPAISAGMTPIGREQRRAAPHRRQNKAKAHRIKKAIGKKRKNKKRRVVSAKVGGNVGSAGKGSKRAFHLHLVTLGTKRRRTKSGANRGRASANDFIKRATRRAAPVAVQKMLFKGVTKAKQLVMEAKAKT